MPKLNPWRRSTRFAGSRWLPLLSALALVAALIISVTGADRQLYGSRDPLRDSKSQFERLTSSKLSASTAALPGGATRPQIITIGFQIDNIYNLSLANHTFMANGRYWIRWPKQVQEWMSAEDINPDQLIEFTNNIASFELRIRPTRSRPKLMPDGSRRMSYAFSGHFWSESIDYQDFPFQNIELPIRFEIAPEEFSLTGPRPVALSSDPRTERVLGALIDLPALELLGSKVEPYLHHFEQYEQTNSDVDNEGGGVYSQIRFAALFRTHLIASLGQWLIPLAILMCTVLAAPNINGKLSEIRITIPSAALLTLVVMQQTYENNTPQLSYLTFLDRIYLWCYVVTVSLFILFSWSANQCSAIDVDSPGAEARLAIVHRRIQRADRSFQIVSLVGTLIVVLLSLRP